MTIYIQRKDPISYEQSDNYDWILDAKCRGVYGLFHAEKSNNPDVQKAKSVCNGDPKAKEAWEREPCPVKRECLAYAIQNNEKFGVWGGQSERERRKTRRYNNIKSRAPRRTVE